MSDRRKRHIVIEPWKPSLPKVPLLEASGETRPIRRLSPEQQKSLKRFTALLRLVFEDPTIIWTGKPGKN